MPYEDNVGDNFSSDMSYRNVGCGFNINESTKYVKIGHILQINGSFVNRNYFKLYSGNLCK